MHENLVKRTLWVVECDCKPGEERFKKEFESDPPRECQCPNCFEWIEPKEITYTGKDKFSET